MYTHELCQVLDLMEELKTLDAAIETITGNTQEGDPVAAMAAVLRDAAQDELDGLLDAMEAEPDTQSTASHMSVFLNGLPWDKVSMLYGSYSRESIRNMVSKYKTK